MTAAREINSTQTQQRGPRRMARALAPEPPPSHAITRVPCAPCPLPGQPCLQLGPETWEPVCLRAAGEAQDSGDLGGGRAARAQGRRAGGPHREGLRGTATSFGHLPGPVDWMQSACPTDPERRRRTLRALCGGRLLSAAASSPSSGHAPCSHVWFSWTTTVSRTRPCALPGPGLGTPRYCPVRHGPRYIIFPRRVTTSEIPAVIESFLTAAVHVSATRRPE